MNARVLSSRRRAGAAVAGFAAGVVLVGGCGPQRVETSAADCAILSEDEQTALADLIVDGVFDEGETDPTTGMLLTPAPLVVERYLKGDGPGRLELPTEIERHPNGNFTISGDSITPVPGERWRIFATWSDGPGSSLLTTSCAGSRPLDPPAITSEHGR